MLLSYFLQKMIIFVMFDWVLVCEKVRCRQSPIHQCTFMLPESCYVSICKRMLHRGYVYLSLVTNMLEYKSDSSKERMHLLSIFGWDLHLLCNMCMLMTHPRDLTL